jgi:hypothetical protein
MARDFIKIDTGMTGATHAGLLRAFVQQMRQAIDTGERVKAIMTHNNDGSNFSDIEALFGIPEGKGQTVFDLVNGAVGSTQGAFQTSDAMTITEKVG